jgi:hypothetical protein
VVTNPSVADLVNHDAWLDQGDLFSEVPIVAVTLSAGEIVTSASSGPAVLMTFGCVLDKHGRDGKLRVERLHFLPLRTTLGLPQDRKAFLRSTADQLQPIEPLYLGEISGFGETYALMSDIVMVPPAYFGLELREVGLDHRGQPDLRPHPTTCDTRIGRLPDHKMELLTAKWLAQWTGLKPEGT